jgi:S-adenosylmethionine:tRNA ribosyltransferase-isomerase
MELFTKDFTYFLPEEKIALFPTEQRDQAKLLVYQKGKIHHDIFKSITTHLPHESLLVFNNSKVIPARLRFKKESGGEIEIFLLNPIVDKSNPAQESPVWNTSLKAQWQCTIGNKKKWNRNTILKLKEGNLELEARLLDEENSIVEFNWSGDKTWNEVLTIFGDTPLPPYIKRDTSKADRERYQTVYSEFRGAVAAPTAGLHFTPELMKELTQFGIKTEFLTLHVGAGTFQPIKTDKATDHRMHAEQIIFTKQNIEHLLGNSEKLIAVGTTSCRSLESLYWLGVKLILDADSVQPDQPFSIDQHFAYQVFDNLPTRKACLQEVHDFFCDNSLDFFSGESSIFIYPGYKFRMTDGLITNFHQPNSTLLLLIAAFIGNDWKILYSEALASNYRFLSYGDSSLLIPS